MEVRQRVARWADTFFDPDAYVIDDSGFPKSGSDSPGVARMYSGTFPLLADRMELFRPVIGGSDGPSSARINTRFTREPRSDRSAGCDSGGRRATFLLHEEVRD